LKPNIKFERDSKQMLAAAQLGVTAPISPTYQRKRQHIKTFDTIYCATYDRYKPETSGISLSGPVVLFRKNHNNEYTIFIEDYDH